jgi:hypothetical protein
MAIPAASFNPASDYVAALIAAVPALVSTSTPAQKRNCIVGPKEAYVVKQSATEPSFGLPDLCVFVYADGGARDFPLKGNFLGETQERHPSIVIRLRGDTNAVPGAFKNGSELARQIYNAVNRKLPTPDYIESVATSALPTYIGPDDDGHHEWMIFVEATVDVLV